MDKPTLIILAILGLTAVVAILGIALLTGDITGEFHRARHRPVVIPRPVVVPVAPATLNCIPRHQPCYTSAMPHLQEKGCCGSWQCRNVGTSAEPYFRCV